MAKPNVPVLVGDRVILRLITCDDLQMTRAWRNDESVRARFFDSNPVSPEQHLAWFAAYQCRDNDFVYIIEETSIFKRPIGQVSLYDIEWEQRRAEFGRLLIGVPEARGLGLAQEATRLLVGCAEDIWGLEEIYLSLYADNQPALAVYRACGFGLTATDGRVVRMKRSNHH
jgi:diamine N-acetyltransferase